MGQRVRLFDWSKSSLGPIDGWPAELKSAAAFVLETRFPAALVWGPDLVTIYNDAFLPILGDKPETLGRSFAEIWAEAWDEIRPLVERAFAGESTFIEDFPLRILRSERPELAYFTFSYSPVRSADGTVMGMIDTVVETTKRVTAEKMLRTREERFRALVTAGSFAVYRMSPDWREMYELKGGNFLSETARPAESWADGYILDEDRPMVFEAIEQAIREKTMFELEHRVRLADGSVGWTLSRAVPILNDKGAIVEWFGAAHDVTERRRANEQLQEREQRLSVIVENARDYAIFLTDANGIVTDWREGAAAVFGFAPEEIVGRSAEILFTPEDRAAHAPEMELGQAAETGKAPDVRWHLRADGCRVFIEGVVTSLHDEQGRLTGFLKIGRDVTERRRAEEHERLLLAELQHRVRNTLAVVRSIARRTAERSDGVEQMIAHFEGRLNAFTRVQSAVTRNPEGGVDLESIVEDELVAVAARDDGPLRITGPPVKLKARAAEALSLAIHELATNAVKYGALASEDGKLDVRWKRENSDGSGRLDLEWVESGLSGIAAPGREGFGHEMLKRSLPYELGAVTDIEFRDEGLRFAMTMPLGPDVLAD